MGGRQEVKDGLTRAEKVCADSRRHTRQVDQMVFEMMAPMKLLNCPCAAELVS